MRWKHYTSNYWEWHPWFAWYPVLLYDKEWVWLETIARRRELLWDTILYKYRELA